MRRIAMVGTASSGLLAPFDDPSFEIWGVSSRGAHVIRAERWFELHRLDGEPQEWANAWRNIIRTFTHELDLYMLYPEPDLGPRVIQYPHDKIVQRFGTFFMSSTFSWMMALAIDEMVPVGTVAKRGENEIAIYGVDMEYGTEYREQRTGFRHFMEIAKQLNIAVTRLAAGGLAYEPVPYPMMQDDPLLAKLALRSADSREKIALFDESLTNTRTLIAQTRAVQDHIAQSHTEGYDEARRLRELDRELDGLMKVSAQISRDLVHWQAVKEEQDWLADYLRH